MKYIIELEDEPCMREDGVNYYTCKSARWYKLGETVINRLTPYTEPDREAIENETWELAERIADMSYDDFISCFEGETEEYVYGLPYHEVKAKYDAWKKRKDEIRVGDEVIYNGDRVVVTDIFLQDITRLWIEGVTSSGKTVEALESDIKKTGRHFPEVEELLNKLVGE